MPTNLRDLCNFFQGTGAMTRPLRVVCDNNEDIKLEVEYGEDEGGYLVLHAYEVYDDDDYDEEEED